MTEEHPFAQYVRIIGKGPHLSRPLSEEEAFAATTMILEGAVEPVQLGAFLCVLRVRTEEPAEAAGFVRAVRQRFEVPANAPRVDLDWPTYAGKSRQLPWYLLSALLLAANGLKVFMHGEDGHTAGRLYARQVLETLGTPASGSFDEAAVRLASDNFAFMPLGALSAPLHAIMELKPLLGLRSPVHTFARMLNPFGAAAEIQGIFHPGYRDVHRDTGVLLGQPAMAVFKGDGGEAERRPNKPVVVQMLQDGARIDEEWPATMGEDEPVAHDVEMDPRHLAAVWRGEAEHRYGEQAVIGTVAIALRVLGRAATPAEAEAQAGAMWAGRDRSRLGLAA